jgi:hypothetical protein
VRCKLKLCKDFLVIGCVFLRSQLQAGLDLRIKIGDHKMVRRVQQGVEIKCAIGHCTAAVPLIDLHLL